MPDEELDLTELARAFAEVVPEVEDDLPQGGGIVYCECPCHKTIEQGGADRWRDCIHCRVIG